jgi:hypothetical protein
MIHLIYGHPNKSDVCLNILLVSSTVTVNNQTNMGKKWKTQKKNKKKQSKNGKKHKHKTTHVSSLFNNQALFVTTLLGCLLIYDRLGSPVPLDGLFPIIFLRVK